MRRITDKNSLIDAIEIANDFVTVYVNSNEPGLPGSSQKKFIEKFTDILPYPNHHDPARFHEPGDPRGSKWRTWENKYACHFHFQGEPKQIIKTILNRTNLSPKLKEELENETLYN